MAPSTTTTKSFAQLEQAALHILRLIRDTPGLANTRLAVVGDLAVCKYLPQYDHVASIDLVISKSSSPGRVRKEIVGHPMSPLVERSGAVYYRHVNSTTKTNHSTSSSSTGWEVEVKLMPDWLCPYLPSAARPVRDNDATLPYVSLEDLLVFKADACGLHENESSKRREATVAAALLELASEHFPLELDDARMDRVEQALADVVEFSPPEHDRSWWQRRLGKMPDKRRSAHEILSELADHTLSSPSSPTTSTASSSSSIYSTMARTPSSGSSMSAHSAASSISSTIPTPSDECYQRPRKMSVTAKPSRHKRHTSTGVSGPTPKSLEVAMQRLALERPASPGVALTNRI